MFALAWQDNDVWSELLLLMKAFTVCGSLTLVEHILERLRYRSVLTSLPDQVSPNARHWCCKTFTTAQSQWLDLHACIHSPFKWNADPTWIMSYIDIDVPVCCWSTLSVASSMYGRTNKARDGMPSLGMTWAISLHDSLIVSQSHANNKYTTVAVCWPVRDLLVGLMTDTSCWIPSAGVRWSPNTNVPSHRSHSYSDVTWNASYY